MQIEDADFLNKETVARALSGDAGAALECAVLAEDPIAEKLAMAGLAVQAFNELKALRKEVADLRNELAEARKDG